MNNEKLNPIDERALDVFLDETLGNAGPPDLSHEILVRLHETPNDVSSGEVNSIVRPEERASRCEPQPSTQRNPVLAAVAVLTTLAAMFVAAMALRPDHQQDQEAASVAENDSASNSQESQIADSPANLQGSAGAIASQTNPKRKPPRGIPMNVDPTSELDRQADGVNHDPNEAIAVVPSLPSSPSLSVSLVSNRVDSELRGYWEAIGIQPSSDADVEEIVARLKVVLGTKISKDAVTDAGRLQAELARKPVAQAVALRWLDQITEGGIGRVAAEARAGLVDDLVGCFQKKQSFDQVLAGWIGGQSPHASAFYAAVSSGPRHASGNDAMTRRLAALTMNVDLRCTRCHDSYIEGNGRQRDYWGFAAFLRQGVARDAKNGLTIDPKVKSSKPVFFELADGRQRVAEPAVANAWMKTLSNRPIDGVKDWSKQMIGSPELARGVVNSLWQLVHGQPLRGRVVDPITAPHHEALDRLEENLTQDLMDSQFDVSRTLALVIASPATRRSIPEPLRPENAWVSKEADSESAMNAVDAFAASLPPRAALPMNQRLDEALRAIGAKLDPNGRPFVAQIGGPNDKPGNVVAKDKSLSADFPERAKSLPVQWLKLVDNEKSRVEHLGYLAGMNQAPTNVVEAAELMQAADVDANLALHRVWWLLHR